MSDVTGPSAAVVEAVAAEAGVDAGALPPLYETVDPDALDALFAPLASGAARERGSVSFTYAGYDVTVDPAGDVETIERGTD